MPFYNTSELVSRTIRRLRQVQGAATQLYAEDVIRDFIEEVYDSVRAVRWWDHLTQVLTRDLDGTTGKITSPIPGLRTGFMDIHSVVYGPGTQQLALMSSDQNPARWTGTRPRAVMPLHASDADYLTKAFRIVPAQSVTDSSNYLTIRCRTDPVNIFTDPAVLVPMDGHLLVNGAALKYAADDGANPGTIAVLDRSFNELLMQLQEQHDRQALLMDPRSGASGINGWQEWP